jgi:rfaE bifunctional protein kinase chain/domain
LKILVIGDIMLDKYVIGNVDRISPESPVPVVEVMEEFYTLGGCGNVAKNLATIGAQTACVAVSGKDKGHQTLHLLMGKYNIKARLVLGSKRPTTVKERIISNHRQIQMLRIDRESKDEVYYKKIISEIAFLKNIKHFHPDIILVSDYCKGVITRDLMKLLETMPAKLIIDPKPAHQYLYKKCFAMTPNEKEYGQMDIWENEGFENVIVTRGKDGVTVYRPRTPYINIPGNEVEVYNVTGAGDSFVAVFSICVGLGLNVLEATKVANSCAAYVVTKPGTSCVPYDIFKYAVELVSK